MCGIIGRIGEDDAVDYIMSGLDTLEYRGYDSAGIAVTDGSKTEILKSVGKLKMLHEKEESHPIKGFAGIGHTRWATHGKPTECNAHPHVSKNGKFYLVHNGIIENSEKLKSEYPEIVPCIMSETDTEVAVQLIERFYNGNPLEAFCKTLKLLDGSFAFAVLCSDFPDRIFCAAKLSPLVVAKGKNGCFIASDVSAVAKYTDSAYSLENCEIGVIYKDSAEFYDKDGIEINKQAFHIEADDAPDSKGSYAHYMLSEIFQQPRAVKNTLLQLTESMKITLPGVDIADGFIENKLDNIVIVGCGSAYHAGLVAKYAFEKLTDVKCTVEIAYEFRYSDLSINENTLAVFISQSGETADTLAALKKAKERSAQILSIVNVSGSIIAKESTEVVFTKAGREVAVATTKAYSAQLAALYAVALFVAEKRSTIEAEQLKTLVHELISLPEKIQLTLESTEGPVKELAEKIYKKNDMYFIGRLSDYSCAMEGSLKMKEISYIHSEAYPAGELKHGTISLVENGTPVIATASDERIFQKTLSNIREVQTRGADVTVITVNAFKEKLKEVSQVIAVPDISSIFAPSLLVIPMQLLSYYTALKRGCDIDKPKNLAKSVTVE